MKKVLFIINPKAGTRSKINLHHFIEKQAGNEIECNFINWESPEQDIVTYIKKFIADKNYDVVAAVGGDGTVNKVAHALYKTSIPLLIIPMGSGNGLARHLKIPMQIKQALNLIHTGKPKLIDTASINDSPYFCTSGVGFDAHISRLFATASKRGLYTYTKLTLQELFNYKPKQYTLYFNNTTIHKTAFLITIANANQWGNDVKIAPMASTSDGLLNIIILKPFKLWNIPSIAYYLLTKKIHHHSLVEIYTTKELLITREKEGSVHYDGEPEHAGNTINYKIKPGTLTVIVQK